MKILLLSGFLFLSYTIGPDSTMVYVCASGNAKKYHLSSSCRGLSNCQHKTIKTTLGKAKKEGKTLCGWEK